MRSCRGALLWSRCAHTALLAAAAGAGHERGRAGGDRAGRGPGGLCHSQPPNRCLPLSTQLDSGRGRWRAAGNRAKGSEESTATGLGTRALPSLTSCAPHTHTQCLTLTHKQLCSHTSTLCHKFRHTAALSHILDYRDTIAPMACDHEGNHFSVWWGECGGGLDRIETPPAPSLPRCCPQLHARCSLHNTSTWWTHTPLHTHSEISELIPHRSRVHTPHGDTQPHSF